ncbi:MAG: hypothetical protein Q8M56_06845 [Desulfobacterales bacterium]|nr:hypothetical protein [Desulfobacterales bacterium]
MLNKLLVFYEYPVGVRYALGLLLGGWISVYAFMYHINTFFPDRFPNTLILKNLVVGIGICYCVFRIKPWARKLCIFFNLGIICVNILFLAIRLTSVGMEPPGLIFHALLNIILFGLCTYYLLIKETSGYFKVREPKKVDEFGREIDEKNL